MSRELLKPHRIGADGYLSVGGPGTYLLGDNVIGSLLSRAVIVHNAATDGEVLLSDGGAVSSVLATSDTPIGVRVIELNAASKHGSWRLSVGSGASVVAIGRFLGGVTQFSEWGTSTISGGAFQYGYRQYYGSDANWRQAHGATEISSGKRVFEVTFTSGKLSGVGVATPAHDNTSSPNSELIMGGRAGSAGISFTAGGALTGSGESGAFSWSSFQPTTMATVPETIMVAIDFDSSQIWLGCTSGWMVVDSGGNATWDNTQDWPALGLNSVLSFDPDLITALTAAGAVGESGNFAEINCGIKPFVRSAPAGFTPVGV